MQAITPQDISINKSHAKLLYSVILIRDLGSSPRAWSEITWWRDFIRGWQYIE